MRYILILSFIFFIPLEAFAQTTRAMKQARENARRNLKNQFYQNSVNRNTTANSDNNGDGMSVDDYYKKFLNEATGATQDAQQESEVNKPDWLETPEGQAYVKEYNLKKKAQEEEQRRFEKMNYFEKQRYLREKKKEESLGRDGRSKDSDNYRSIDF